jgi:hypothetical protein
VSMESTLRCSSILYEHSPKDLISRTSFRAFGHAVKKLILRSFTGSFANHLNRVNLTRHICLKLAMVAE